MKRSRLVVLLQKFSYVLSSCCFMLQTLGGINPCRSSSSRSRLLKAVPLLVTGLSRMSCPFIETAMYFCPVAGSIFTPSFIPISWIDTLWSHYPVIPEHGFFDCDAQPVVR